MKKLILLFIFFTSISLLGQVADHVVISEIYPGGGNSGAIYTNDFITLYNPTSSTVDLSTWSIQYQAVTSNASPWSLTNSTRVNLAGTVAAYAYYLIKGYSPTTPAGTALPNTENVSGTINLAVTGGKLALVKSTTPISGISDANVVDFIGWGSGTYLVYEGSSAAPAPGSNSVSLCRKDNSGNSTYQTNGSGWDSENNGLDFWPNSNSSPLPVELTSFTSDVLDKKVFLNWATATEVNNYGFDVERKSENADWMKIGFVEGNGNSNSPKSYSFTDEPRGGREFKYRLKQIDLDGSYEYSDVVTALLENVSEFVLDQNFPNPFNPVTRISYTLPERASVRLKVYDMLAKEVSELVNGYQEAGRYEVTFDGSSLSSGTYFYKLEAGSFVEVKKLVLIK
jgi:hypothetical protein